MTHARRSILLGFTSTPFPEGTHICYIYADDDERRTVMSAFVESGLNEGERVLYFVDDMTPEALRFVLAEQGIVLPGAEDGHVSVAAADETYCPDHRFVPERTLDMLRSTYTGSIKTGYPGVRGTGEMSWALKGFPGSDRLIEYETGINIMVRDYPITAVCQYDARRFDGATIFNVLNVHPMMIVRGQVVRNPYYDASEPYSPKLRPSLNR